MKFTEFLVLVKSNHILFSNEIIEMDTRDNDPRCRNRYGEPDIPRRVLRNTKQDIDAWNDLGKCSLCVYCPKCNRDVKGEEGYFLGCDELTTVADYVEESIGDIMGEDIYIYEYPEGAASYYNLVKQNDDDLARLQLLQAQ